MFYKRILCVLALINCSLGHAQSVRDIFQKMGKYHSAAEPLQYKSHYTLYRDYDSKKIEESYKGTFYKNVSNEVYAKIGETEIISSRTAFLKISHQEKAIQILNPIPNYMGDFDIKPLLDRCRIEKFLDYKAYWEITLSAKPYSSLAYSKIVVQISKDYLLRKRIFYYNAAVNFSKDYRRADPHYPRLEVTNSDYSRNPIKAGIFESSTYFTRSGTKQIVLSEKLKKYEIID